MIGRIKLGFVLLCITSTTLVLAPVQYFAIRFDLGLARKLPLVWHRIACWLIGMRVGANRRLPDDKRVLIVANHVSWLDIVVLGRLFPASFIAKEEVGAIPGANLLARLQRTVFVQRADRRKAGEQADEISTRLLRGDVMVLFAEGTTGTGNRLLPFKSALFGAAHMVLKSGSAREILVQPVAIRYTHQNGVPLGRAGRAQIAWPGDVELAPHFSQIVRGGPLDVLVSLADPITVTKDMRRREISSLSHDAIRQLLTRLDSSKT